MDASPWREPVHDLLPPAPLSEAGSGRVPNPTRGETQCCGENDTHLGARGTPMHEGLGSSERPLRPITGNVRKSELAAVAPSIEQRAVRVVLIAGQQEGRRIVRQCRFGNMAGD